jgi:hypothetical protein
LDFSMAVICSHCLEAAFGCCKVHPHFFNNHTRRKVVEDDEGSIEKEDPCEDPG